MRKKRERIKNPFLVDMGAKMKAIRHSRGINLREMGKLTKLDYTCICRIEGGRYGSQITTLKIIADVLECDVKDFL